MSAPTTQIQRRPDVPDVGYITPDDAHHVIFAKLESDDLTGIDPGGFRYSIIIAAMRATPDELDLLRQVDRFRGIVAAVVLTEREHDQDNPEGLKALRDIAMRRPRVRAFSRKAS